MAKKKRDRRRPIKLRFFDKASAPRLTVPIGWKRLAYELLEELKQLRGERRRKDD